MLFRLMIIIFQFHLNVIFILECGKFTYGEECSQTCGNCSKGEQCNHVNGSCLNGCDVGVYGDQCDSGKRNSLLLFVVIIMIIIIFKITFKQNMLYTYCKPKNSCWMMKIKTRLKAEKTAMMNTQYLRNFFN